VPKVSKQMLKSIVKECLVEILTEGMGPSEKLNEAVRHRQDTPQRTQTAERPRPKPIYEQMEESFQRGNVNTPKKFDKSVAAASRMATNDPIMQQILAETAKTTYQDQMSAERQIPRGLDAASAGYSGDIPVGESAGLDIDSIFGNASKNWEVLLGGAAAKTK
jgi:hypothetical protein